MSSHGKRWDVTLYQGGFIIDAETEYEARVEALQCLAESLDLFVVSEIRDEEAVVEE